MAWLGEPLEDLLRTELPKQIGQHEADDLLAVYATSLTRLRNDIWPVIAATEPHLTNHGEAHIRHVMRNAYQLIKPSDNDALDLFALAQMILFHDVGNLDGRKEHNLKIASIYDDIHPPANANSALRNAILQGCRAHCGYTSDGSSDTLLEIGPDPYPLYYAGIRLQQMAAVLRFADELSEDQRRTSRYMLNHHKIPIENQIHHWYATITAPSIDTNGGRIILHYNITCPDNSSPEWGEFENLLEQRVSYLTSRIDKLDIERRYNGFYSPAVRALDRTEFSIYVHCQGKRLPCQERPFVLSDLITPDSGSQSIATRWPQLDAAALSRYILKGITNGS